MTGKRIFRPLKVAVVHQRDWQRGIDRDVIVISKLWLPSIQVIADFRFAAAKDRSVLLLSAWRCARAAWRDLVLGPDWPKRRHVRRERAFRARVLFAESWHMHAVSWERAECALQAAAYNPERARLWLWLSERLGRDATWTELKEAVALEAQRKP